MRIYGSSPLYNYVELIFRCKRMFIITIVLGTVIASAMVSSRATSYNASMLMALSGDPVLVAQLRNPLAAAQVDRENSPSKRKALRLRVAIEQEPDFLGSIAADLRKKYSLAKSEEDIAKDIRAKLAPPELITEQFVQLKLTWPDKGQAEDILNRIFIAFHNRSVDEDTVTTANLMTIAKKQFDAAETKANALARVRVAYQSIHYNNIPTMLSAQIGRAEQSQTQLEDAKLDLSDAKQRLNDIGTQIRSVPQEIVEATREGGIIPHPEIALSQEYDDLEKQYKQLTAIYSPQHPKVIDLQKRMSSLKEQIAEATQKAKIQPQAPKATTFETARTSNPEYREMSQQKHEFERTVSALSRRVTELSATLAKSRSSIQVMPNTEIEWQNIDSNYQLADTIRRNRKAQLETIKLDLERDKEVSEKEVTLRVPPKAEKADTGGKIIALFALGPILGIVIAFCFSLLVESLDHTLRTPVEVEKYLNKPVLAVIPKMAAAREGRKQLGGSSKSSISS